MTTSRGQPRSPWTFRLQEDEEERVRRAARHYGFVVGDRIHKTDVLKFALDEFVAGYVKARIAGAGGFASALDDGMRGLRTLLCDAVAICRGDERGILVMLGASEAEWATALVRFPEVATAMDAERAKRRRE